MNHSNQLSKLLAPISSNAPAGEDLSYSRLFDQIKEARRADDPSLSQGDWEQQLKSADWKTVVQLCEQAIALQSKDLQLAVWYGEALVKTQGFAGAILAMDLIHGLLEQYWENCFPELDPHDLDERVGKLEWFNVQIGRALREVAITSPQHGAYHWQHWQESREVENLGLKNYEEKEKAIAQGKLAGDVFDKSAQASGSLWFVQLQQQITAALESYQRLDQQIDLKFAHAAPNLSELRTALNAILEVVTRISSQWSTAEPPTLIQAAAPSQETHAMLNSIEIERTSHTQANGVAKAAQRSGPIQTRAEAVRQLTEVARYFRQHEPHSPVALLAERAAKWAEMSLEEWLSSVIKDDSTLGQLNELLDIRKD